MASPQNRGHRPFDVQLTAVISSVKSSRSSLLVSAASRCCSARKPSRSGSTSRKNATFQLFNSLPIRTMLEALSGFVGKVAGALVRPAWDYLVTTFHRPSIRLRKAPKNLLDHLKPSTSRDRVRELLGPPHQEVESHWFYRFADALVQVEFWSGGGAKVIALGLVGKGKKHRFAVPICRKPLGQLTIADVLEEGDTLRYRSSLRHEEMLVEVRLGPPGAWSNWTFGAMMAVGSRALRESYFEWDREAERLKTAQSLVLVNWVAVSSSSDEAWFDWSMG